MKVALLGNMNNNFFAACRHLRDRGIDAHLFLFDEFNHFRPEADTFNLDFRSYTHQLFWHKKNPIGNTSLPKEICADLREFDFIIGTYWAPAYLHLAGKQCDLFVPHGSDIKEFPFYSLPAISKWKKFKRFLIYRLDSAARFGEDRNKLFLAKKQRLGIQQSPHIAEFGEDTEEMLTSIEKLNVKPKMLDIPIPMVYFKEYHEVFYQNTRHVCTHWSDYFMELRKNSDILIVHQTRHCWKKGRSTQKGNDILLSGIAEFVKRQPQVRINLATMEYGPDVELSKQLIAELGISQQVHWFPQMLRKDLMFCLSLADIGAAKFRINAITGGDIYEQLAMKLPVLQHRDDNVFEKKYGKLYPIMNANTPEAVASYLEDYIANKNHYKEMGTQSHEWFKKNVIERPITKYIELIEQKAALLQKQNS